MAFCIFIDNQVGYESRDIPETPDVGFGESTEFQPGQVIEEEQPWMVLAVSPESPEELMGMGFIGSGDGRHQDVEFLRYPVDFTDGFRQFLNGLDVFQGADGYDDIEIIIGKIHGGCVADDEIDFLVHHLILFDVQSVKLDIWIVTDELQDILSLCAADVQHAYLAFRIGQLVVGHLVERIEPALFEGL